MLIRFTTKKKQQKIVVCHINHNVRKESIEEEEYITKYCQDKNIILEKTTINNYQENNFENEAKKDICSMKKY